MLDSISIAFQEYFFGFYFVFYKKNILSFKSVFFAFYFEKIKRIVSIIYYLQYVIKNKKNV